MNHKSSPFPLLQQLPNISIPPIKVFLVLSYGIYYSNYKKSVTKRNNYKKIYKKTIQKRKKQWYNLRKEKNNKSITKNKMLRHKKKII